MLQISKQQALQRYDVLPKSLREELFSAENAETIRFLSYENQINEEQIGELAKIAGNVVFGFLNVNDVAKELKESLGIDDAKAQIIFRGLNQKIFSRLKEEIAKIFAPPAPSIAKSTEETFAEAMPSAPRANATASPSPLPPHPVNKSFKEFLMPDFSKTAEPTAKPATDPIPKIREAEPIVDLQSFQIKKESAKAKTTPEPEIPLAAPFILHKTDQITPGAPATETPKIKPGLSIKTPSFSQPAAEKPTAPKPVSVKIEMPNSHEPASRVVHYSDLRTPLNAAGLTKPEITENTVDLRKVFKEETAPDSNTVDLSR